MKLFQLLVINTFINNTISISLIKPVINFFRRIKPRQSNNHVKQEISPREKYDMSWYVVAEASEIKKNMPFKVTVWDKDYVIWKSSSGAYNALDDICPHKGASLSGGTITNNRIMCPYHGYEFSNTGNLTIVPGICFQKTSQQNAARFSVVEKHGWIYLNTYEIPWFATQMHLDELNKNIFIEPEANDNNMSVIFVNKIFNTFARVVSENSLDIMHIAYVHTFGNKNKPAPSYENPPKEITKGHWRTSYIYESGENSMVSKVFQIKKIDIENEFSLPHTTVARVKFGEGYVNTIITSACPINNGKTRLFVKNYRNFFANPMFDSMFERMMIDTLNQDKGVIESIKIENMDGKFNMKFDKLQNTYKSFYKNHVKDVSL